MNPMIDDNGIVREMTDDEVDLYGVNDSEPEAEPTAEERIAELESQNAMLLECVLEMSEIIYA